MTDEIKILPHELDALLICSTRYALRRRSYIVSGVTRSLIKYAKYLHENSINVIKKDISDYLTTLTEHDDDCDIKEWRKAMEVMNDRAS